MSYYAGNASAGGGGYAPLTGGLLARKGEALPAVDAVAHEGVDIDMRPMQPANSPGAPANISEQSISSLRRQRPAMRRPATGGASPGHGDGEPSRAPVRLVHSSPDKWQGTPANQGAPLRQGPAASGQAAGARPQGRNAIVKLRMPASVLVRLRYAARDLEMSCQAIVLEALECYLDANDVAPVTDDAIRHELERLLARRRKG